MAAQVRTVGVRELRQNLSVYLAPVKKGQVLTVAEHGRAAAELRPLAPPTDALGRLVEEGRVVPARRLPAELPRPLELPTERPVPVLLSTSLRRLDLAGIRPHARLRLPGCLRAGDTRLQAGAAA